jgi:cbb3-type cytochrome oxidase subunit 3
VNPVVVEVMSTIAAMLAFVAVVGWAYSSRPTEAFKQASLIPFDEDDSEHARD